MIRGRAAERAVELAGARYEKQGRGSLVKQATPMRFYGGEWHHNGKAPIDFRGTISATGRSLCIEVKETGGTAFEMRDDKLSELQIAAMNKEHRFKAACALVIDMYDHDEAYIIPWSKVQEFIAAPYRKSLSLEWLRAFGSVCETEGRNTEDFVIKYLDTYRHNGWEAAEEAEKADRAKSKIVEAEKVIPQLKSPAPELRRTDKAAYDARIMGLAEQGIAHVMGSKKKTFGRRGRG